MTRSSLSTDPGPSTVPGPVAGREEIRLQLRSWPEVEAYLTHCRGVIVPLGSTEQHGPTGAIGTDALTAEAVALEVGCRTGVLVTPAQAFGMAEHHLGFAGTISLQPSTLLAVLHDVVLSLARHGFERIYVINGHGGNIATARAAFAQAYGTAAARGLPGAERLRCRLANWFTAGPVMREARDRYGEREGHHATPSEIALTLHLEPSLTAKQRPLPEAAPAGPIHGPEDFRRRHPDGRMGSDPFLATADDGARFLELAAAALSEDLAAFLGPEGEAG
ncbi:MULTISPECIES: creatininase family protein [unclassified Cyanobium]|uniref:creatininase family protein n=1 Tax=unclassified Cyanobium TaxID=2627006 RepID=UPI0020CD8577|nr:MULTISPECIES: creatininase family protein [unclassified Cyanobium]MCP9835798.1 creatininase family protein [Cyanobium sp. La Preciosa 7G6]MCP9938564.1 creatininase family protein [Cyanobium sp. Aljojuca 7A6]